MNLDLLPDDCFAHILSLTSPIDACRISLVSSSIRISANSDNVWEKFLPPDYQQILTRLRHPLIFSSKKHLFFRWWIKYEFFNVKIHICSTRLWMQNMTLTFSLEKTTGKKQYMLSARELNIAWADNPLFWSWKPFPTSRFVEAVELRTIWWLEIQGKINSGMLSPKTTYECYVIVKFVDRAYGLDFLPSKVTVEIGNVKSEGNVYLRQYESKKQCLETLWYSNRMELVLRSMAFRGIMEERVACKREDGWIEIELGSFYNNGGDNLEVKMSLKEVTGTHLKGGLVVEGIELRPKQQTTANHIYNTDLTLKENLISWNMFLLRSTCRRMFLGEEVGDIRSPRAHGNPGFGFSAVSGLKMDGV
ncbi:hypothetical protein GOBAR_DD01020 [Gossypium barbadense]|nr:hypothetical protein GOBAR_DD01020 [Gossypium barbadense]